MCRLYVSSSLSISAQQSATVLSLTTEAYIILRWLFLDQGLITVVYCHAPVRLSYTKDTGSRPVVRSSVSCENVQIYEFSFTITLEQVSGEMEPAVTHRNGDAAGQDWSHEEGRERWWCMNGPGRQQQLMIEIIHNIVLSVELQSLCVCFVYRHIHKIRAYAHIWVIFSWKNMQTFVVMRRDL